MMQKLFIVDDSGSGSGAVVGIRMYHLRRTKYAIYLNKISSPNKVLNDINYVTQQTFLELTVRKVSCGEFS